MKRWAGLLMMLLVLSGCSPVAREPDNLALVRVLGVDGSSPVTLTAVSGKDSQSTIQRGSAKALNFEQSRQELIWSGNGKELSLTGVSYLLVGLDVELENILYAILNDADLGASATVWVVPSGAKKLLGQCKDPAADLELLTLRGVPAPSVAQVLASLSTNGEVALPCLKEKDGQFEECGTYLWRKNN